MEPRRTTKVIRFLHPFTLRDADRILEPGDYDVITEEELIEGVSFPAHRRISTLVAAQERDAGLSSS